MTCELVFNFSPCRSDPTRHGKEWVPSRGKWEMGVVDAQNAKEKGRQEKEGGSA